MRRAVGVDFGTTNSALALAVGMEEAPRLAHYERAGAPPTPTFRSLLYLERDPDLGDRIVERAGPRAIEAYLDADEPGRLIQSLKSFLGNRDFSSTGVLGQSYRLEALISIILRKLRESAEAEFGVLPRRIVAGRPVRFAAAKDESDTELALSRLEASFHNAGFEEVVFEFEPVAAAYHYERDLDHDELILIGDFGGGTSDFSLLRVGPSLRGTAGREDGILGNAGVPVAGDAFDGAIVRWTVAPLLGRGTDYKTMFGQVLRVPAWIYRHLERWHHLSFLKSPQTLHILHDLCRRRPEARALRGPPAPGPARARLPALPCRRGRQGRALERAGDDPPLHAPPRPDRRAALPRRLRELESQKTWTRSPPASTTSSRQAPSRQIR